MRLPAPARPVSGCLEAAIAARRTAREFADAQVSLRDAAQLSCRSAC